MLSFNKFIKNNKKIFKLLIEIVLLIVFIYLISWWQTRNLLAEGQSAPYRDQSVSFLKQAPAPLIAPDKINVLYFFAPWCNICHYSINSLDNMSSTDVNVIRVALDYQSVTEVTDFIIATNAQGAVALGDQYLQQAYQINAFPTVYVITGEGVIASKSVGFTAAMGTKLRLALGKMNM